MDKETFQKELKKIIDEISMKIKTLEDLTKFIKDNPIDESE